MHESEPRGMLVTKAGKPISDELLASAACTDIQTVRVLIQELETNGVFSRTPEGWIYSRRMVHDEAEREKTNDRVRRFRARGEAHTDTDEKRQSNAEESESESESESEPYTYKEENPLLPPTPSSTVTEPVAAAGSLHSISKKKPKIKTALACRVSNADFKAISIRCMEVGLPVPSLPLVSEILSKFPGKTGAEVAAILPLFPGQTTPGLYIHKSGAEIEAEFARQRITPARRSKAEESHDRLMDWAEQWNRRKAANGTV
jgi:hypothetical protein